MPDRVAVAAAADATAAANGLLSAGQLSSVRASSPAAL
jgi:hypothetical protein